MWEKIHQSCKGENGPTLLRTRVTKQGWIVSDRENTFFVPDPDGDWDVGNDTEDSISIEKK